MNNLNVQGQRMQIKSQLLAHTATPTTLDLRKKSESLEEN